jgi:hypothetical protein
MVTPLLAKGIFGMSVTRQILLGMSNFGLTLGVIGICATSVIKTPLPWLRFAALSFLLIWMIIFYVPPADELCYAFLLALLFAPLSFGWSAGDQALTMYIEKSAAWRIVGDDIPLLGAITSFLYASYVVIFVVLSIVLGRFIDSTETKTALLDIGGIQFSAIAILVLCSTFIPQGALSFNPRRLSSGDSPKRQKIGYNSLSTMTSDGQIELGSIRSTDTRT